MDYYDILLASKLSEGGGGGSSDFSTAEVTTINKTNETIMGIHIPTVCEENELGEGSPAVLFNEMIIPTGTSTHKVRMYKGLAYCGNVLFNGDFIITTSGNIEFEDTNAFITGDCTITIDVAQ